MSAVCPLGPGRTLGALGTGQALRPWPACYALAALATLGPGPALSTRGTLRALGTDRTLRTSCALGTGNASALGTLSALGPLGTGTAAPTSTFEGQRPGDPRHPHRGHGDRMRPRRCRQSGRVQPVVTTPGHCLYITARRYLNLNRGGYVVEVTIDRDTNGYEVNLARLYLDSAPVQRDLVPLPGCKGNGSSRTKQGRSGPVPNLESEPVGQDPGVLGVREGH